MSGVSLWQEKSEVRLAFELFLQEILCVFNARIFQSLKATTGKWVCIETCLFQWAIGIKHLAGVGGLRKRGRYLLGRQEKSWSSSWQCVFISKKIRRKMVR
jgi:hypothetical protein